MTKISNKVLNAMQEETAFQAKMKKHDKTAQMLVEKFMDKVDLWGFLNSSISELAKKDGLDVSELDEFDIEPYDTLLREKLKNYINSMS